LEECLYICLKVVTPLIVVYRLVNSYVKPTMTFTYSVYIFTTISYLTLGSYKEKEWFALENDE